MTTSLEKDALAVCTGANFGMDRKYDYAMNFIHLLIAVVIDAVVSNLLHSVPSMIVLAHFSHE